jgi:hypothetical protein
MGEVKKNYRATTNAPFPAVHSVQSMPSPAITEPIVLFHEFSGHFWQVSAVSS